MALDDATYTSSDGALDNDAHNAASTLVAITSTSVVPAPSPSSKTRKSKRPRAVLAAPRRSRPRLGHPLLDRRVRVLWDNHDKDEPSWYDGVVVEHVNWHEPEKEAMLRIRYDDGEVKASMASDIRVIDDDGVAGSLLLLQEPTLKQQHAGGESLELVESKGVEELKTTDPCLFQEKVQAKSDPLYPPDPAYVTAGIKLLEVELEAKELQVQQGAERSCTPSPTDAEVMEMLTGIPDGAVTNKCKHNKEPKEEPISLNQALPHDDGVLHDDNVPLLQRKIYLQAMGGHIPAQSSAPTSLWVHAVSPARAQHATKKSKKVTWCSQLEKVFSIPARKGATGRSTEQVQPHVYVPLFRGAQIGMLNSMQKTIKQLGVNIR